LIPLKTINYLLAETSLSKFISLTVVKTRAESGPEGSKMMAGP
jgi:hypothetical protein